MNPFIPTQLEILVNGTWLQIHLSSYVAPPVVEPGSFGFASWARGGRADCNCHVEAPLGLGLFQVRVDDLQGTLDIRWPSETGGRYGVLKLRREASAAT